MPASYFFQQEDREVPSHTVEDNNSPSPASSSSPPCERHDQTSLCFCNVCAPPYIPPQQQQLQSSRQPAPPTISLANSLVPFPTSNHNHTDINSNLAPLPSTSHDRPAPLNTNPQSIPSYHQDHGQATPPPSSQQEETQELPIPLPGELPSLQEAHRTQIPTLTHIPKAARGQWSKVLAELCNRVANTPEVHSLWLLLSIFPRCILPASKVARYADGHSQARVVRERLDRWRHGHYRDL